MKNILALMDLDFKGELVMNTALRIAKENNAKLFVYHHLYKGDQLSIDPKGISNLKMKSTGKTNSTYRFPFKDSAFYRLGSGNFKTSIIDLVKQEEIDMIVMGSNGESNIKERFFGSHAAIVMENISCSVLVIKDEPLSHNVKEVVFASAFNEMDKEVFKYFLHFLKLPSDAVIHLLMVDTYTFFNQPTALIKEAFNDFKELAKPFKSVEHFHRGISVEDGVTKFMLEVQPDLLVMSNKYSRMIRTGLSGSKMVATLHENPYPFLNIDYEKAAIPV